MYPGKIYLVGGGVPLALDGVIIGAVGVAGLPEGVDEKSASAGIDAWMKFRETMKREGRNEHKGRVSTQDQVQERRPEAARSIRRRRTGSNLPDGAEDSGRHSPRAVYRRARGCDGTREQPAERNPDVGIRDPGRSRQACSGIRGVSVDRIPFFH